MTENHTTNKSDSTTQEYVCISYLVYNIRVCTSTKLSTSLGP